jgi:hypothetical protein
MLNFRPFALPYDKDLLFSGDGTVLSKTPRVDSIRLFPYRVSEAAIVLA